MRARRAVCGLIAALLSLGACALIAAHTRPDHNVEPLAVAARATRAASGASVPAASLPAPTGDINVNTATAEQLERVVGIGPSLAAAIIAERETNGRFVYVEDLLAVKGIGRSTLRKLLPQIRLD